MPLILNRKPGQRTTITFPDGSVAVVECTGGSHAVARHDAPLTFGHTAGGIYLRPAGEDWPVCIIEIAGRVEGSSSAAFSFDAPSEVKIHRDDIRRKL